MATGLVGASSYAALRWRSRRKIGQHAEQGLDTETDDHQA
jgi:hypothetical protein